MTKQVFTFRFLATTCILFAFGGTGEAAISSRLKVSGNASEPQPPSSKIICERNYTLTVRVRPLLFWISRPGVGGGRIAWSEESNGRKGVELLIGSDPARAPMRINRWGYISERVTGSSAELLGVMTASEEQSIEQARAELNRSTGTHVFKAIRGALEEGNVQSTVTWMRLSRDFTYRDLNALLERLPPPDTPPRQMCLPPGTETGFLFSLKGMIRETVERYCQTGQTGANRPAHRRYVYYNSLFELSLRSSRFLPEVELNGRPFHAILESEFEARNLSTGKTSRFSIACGTKVPLAEIPIRIIYRPRWWFEAELLLEGINEAAQVSGGGISWNPGSH
jgi:hypothetical protein